MACTCAEDGLIRAEDGVTVRIQVRARVPLRGRDIARNPIEHCSGLSGTIGRASPQWGAQTMQEFISNDDQD